MLEALEHAGFDVATRNHARAILTGDFPASFKGLIDTLLKFRLSAPEIIGSGGGQAASTMRLRDALYDIGWGKHKFIIQTIVDGDERESISHEIDHVLRTPAGTIALEIEWNNKDPFFDRDLENFQRLHAQSAISLGVLITRGASLQSSLKEVVASTLTKEAISDLKQLNAWGVKDRTSRQTKHLDRLLEKGVSFPEAFARSFVSDKFGASTTHWARLEDRISRGVGNPCPLLLVGLPLSIVEDHSAATVEL